VCAQSLDNDLQEQKKICIDNLIRYFNDSFKLLFFIDNNGAIPLLFVLKLEKMATQLAQKAIEQFLVSNCIINKEFMKQEVLLILSKQCGITDNIDNENSLSRKIINMINLCFNYQFSNKHTEGSTLEQKEYFYKNWWTVLDKELEKLKYFVEKKQADNVHSMSNILKIKSKL